MTKLARASPEYLVGAWSEYLVGAYLKYGPVKKILIVTIIFIYFFR